MTFKPRSHNRRCVLLTGGRAAVTLELARMFHKAGYRVLMGEHIWWHLSRYSRAVEREYRLPWPTQDHAGFVEALREIIVREKVDLLLPTCEEVFHVARGLQTLEPHCRVLVPPIEALHQVHNKWLFFQRAQQHKLQTPSTRLVESPQDLRSSVGKPVVLKPVYSRFAARTVICPQSPQELADIVPSQQEQWLEQEFIPGRHYCTWGLADQGRLVAHVVYETRFTLGIGASITFESVQHPGVEQWVETFVEQEGFHGQIAFDMIESEDGQVYGLECNPRTTSGFHLFAHDPRILEALWNPSSVAERLYPANSQPAMLGVSMVLRLLGKVRTREELKAWRKEFSRSREVVASRWDPVPVVWRYLWLGGIVARARSLGLPPQIAVSVDMEWNGEGLE